MLTILGDLLTLFANSLVDGICSLRSHIPGPATGALTFTFARALWALAAFFIARVYVSGAHDTLAMKNARHLRCRANVNVIRLGFEPKTHSLEGCCSIQLSYRTGPFKINVVKNDGD